MTLYEVLGISSDASAEEIDRAFKRLARQFHPDHNPGSAGAAERMKQLNEARATLANARLRADYDDSLRTRRTVPLPTGGGPARTPTPVHVTVGTDKTSLFASRIWRFGIGLVMGGLLAMFWGPMLPDEMPHRHSPFSVVTGLLVGLLTATIRMPIVPAVGGALLGLCVTFPYAIASDAYSSLLGGAVFGGAIAWVVSYR